MAYVFVDVVPALHRYVSWSMMWEYDTRIRWVGPSLPELWHHVGDKNWVLRTEWAAPWRVFVGFTHHALEC